MEEKIKKTSLNKYYYFEAIDGRTDLKKYKFKIMNGWEDPIWKRPINIGEIGCSLSHYFVWKYIVTNSLERVLILEDDAIFLDNFDDSLKNILNLKLDYDIFYLNRIKLNKRYNLGIEDTIVYPIVKAKYSYNASSYIITLNGAKKLLSCNFLNNLLPIDEFLPIMYDTSYPFKEYSEVFKDFDKIIALGLINDITDQESRENHPSTILDAPVFIST